MKLLYTLLLIPLSLISTTPFSAELNESSSENSGMELIVVTAQKRVQTLQDVPLSVSVFSGDKIDKEATANLEEVSFSIPNLTINESGISTNLFIRGVGSGVNLGFEQTVGTYIDGVYYGRARSARSSFLDIQRIEVLKGPQDTLFGKNAIAGALNITTRQPSYDLEGYVEVNSEPEFDGLGFKGAISVPISDELTTRFAFMKHVEDGWIYNTNTNQTERQKEDLIFRTTLLWEPNDDIAMTIKAEYGKLDAVGRTVVVSQYPDTLPLYAFAKNTDPDFGDGLNQTKSMGSATGSFMGLESSDNETNLLSMNLNIEFDSGTLTSLSAYNFYEFNDQADVDYLPIDLIHLSSFQENTQLSQEVRFTSNTLDNFNYIIGLYYQHSDLNSLRNTDINGNLIGQGYSGRRSNTFEQESTNQAIFGQGNYEFNSNWTVNFGARLSKSKKTLFKKLYIAELMSNQLNTDPRANFIVKNVLNIVPHQFSTESTRNGALIDFDPVREETNVSPSLSIQYFHESDAMLYASISKGFKGGGFDEDNSPGDPDNEEYESEDVIAYEIGSKMTLFDQLSVNLSIFRSEYDNIQVSTYDGQSGFNVGNAAQSISQGVELDGRWYINEQWQINYALAYLDAYYDSYAEGQCTSAATNCNDARFQDLSGKPLQFSPKWNGNINVQFEQTLQKNWLVVANVTLLYSDEYQVPGDLDPILAQDAFSKINARIQFGDYDQSWYISIIGKNLTDEITSSWGNDIPLSPGGFFQHVDPPRSVELALNWKF